MHRKFLAAALASAVALPLLVGTAGAAGVKFFGASATPDDLISALQPQSSGAPAMKLRGVRQLQAKPAAEPEGRAPAVALDIKFGANTAELTPEAKDVIKQLATAMSSEQLTTLLPSGENLASRTISPCPRNTLSCFPFATLKMRTV